MKVIDLYNKCGSLFSVIGGSTATEEMFMPLNTLLKQYFEIRIAERNVNTIAISLEYRHRQWTVGITTFMEQDGEEISLFSDISTNMFVGNDICKVGARRVETFETTDTLIEHIANALLDMIEVK